jgi:hypothetical protein
MKADRFEVGTKKLTPICMMKKTSVTSKVQHFGLGCLLLGALSGPTLADSGSGESREPLRAISVVSTTGNAENPESLIDGHNGYTTLTMVQGGPAPMIVLDYGHDVGGLPVFEVSSVSGTPQLQAIYSESQQNLLPAGDGAPAFPNAPGDPSRVDTYRVSGPGLIVNRLIQGGERFEAITLTAPGTVTLRAVGIRSTTFHPPRRANLGYFRSSDPRLDEVWGLGAYTLSLDQLRAGAVPALWQVTAEGVDVRSGLELHSRPASRSRGYRRIWRRHRGRTPPHGVDADDRHAPDGGLGSAMLDRTPLQLGSGPGRLCYRSREPNAQLMARESAKAAMVDVRFVIVLLSQCDHSNYRFLFSARYAK